MEIEFDQRKSAKNGVDRGLPFELVATLEWNRAFVSIDRRRDYGEDRLVALVPMNGRLHVVCYVIRGEKRRVVSFRKANKREERAYAEATTTDK
jgi:uncharacterized DUF497 family protein